MWRRAHLLESCFICCVVMWKLCSSVEERQGLVERRQQHAAVDVPIMLMEASDCAECAVRVLGL